MSHRLRFVVVIVLAVVTALGHPSPETTVKERAEHYYRAWQKKDVDALWSFLSPEIRHHDGAEEYKQSLGAFLQDTTLVSFQVNQVSVDKGIAWVDAAVVVNIQSGKEHTYKVAQKTRWILVASQSDKSNPDWYLEESPRVNAQIDPQQDLPIKRTEQTARSEGSLHKNNSASILAFNLE